MEVSLNGKHVGGSPMTIKVISPNSKGLLCKFSSKGSRVNEVRWPGGIIFHNGKVLVCDQFNKRLQLFTLHGQHLRVIYLTNFPTPIQPECVAVSEKGHIFLTADKSNQVFVCDENGKLIRIFGENECKGLWGIAISPVNGRVYVADGEGGCVRVYTQDGKYVKSFSSRTTTDVLMFPTGITVDSKGNVIVTSFTSVIVFESNGEYLYRFGDSGLGKIEHAYDVSTDKNGYVYVYDIQKRTINKYQPKSGKFISTIHNVTDEEYSLGGMCVTDDESCKIVVSDRSGDCIKVFTE
ncbi:protein meiotic P26-like [Glandiceps talaboti]